MSVLKIIVTMKINPSSGAPLFQEHSKPGIFGFLLNTSKAYVGRTSTYLKWKVAKKLSFSGAKASQKSINKIFFSRIPGDPIITGKNLKAK